MEEQVNNKIIELVDVTKKYDDTVVIEAEFGPLGQNKTVTGTITSNPLPPNGNYAVFSLYAARNGYYPPVCRRTVTRREQKCYIKFRFFLYLFVCLWNNENRFLKQKK